jgi:hypothetical protein
LASSGVTPRGAASGTRLHPGANPSGARPLLHRRVLLRGPPSLPSGAVLRDHSARVCSGLLAEQPTWLASTAVSFGRPPGLLRESNRRSNSAACSSGSPPRWCPWENHSTPSHSTGFRSDSSVRSHLVATPGGADSICRFRSCSADEMKGTGRVSADARRATVRCWQQVFGPAAGRAPVQQPPSACRSSTRCALAGSS